MAAPRRRYFWAVVSPSARHTVDYLESPFATLAAANVKSGEYLALVVEPERVPRFGLPLSKSAVAYLVQPASLEPLPETYLPIAPCRMGSRDPLDPQFLWPFEACVVNTGRILVFDPVGIQEAAVKTAHVLSQDVAEAFASIHCEDFDVQTLLNYQKRLADELVEQGVEDLTSEDTWWTTFSVKSTAAQLVPGEFFPPEDISAKIHFDIESLERLLPASQCFEDVREIKRLRARFSRPQTERTIRWTLNQAACTSVDVPFEARIEELSNPDTIESLAGLERPHSPDRLEETAKATCPEEEQEAEEGFMRDWAGGHLDGIPHVSPPPPPGFEPYALKIVYFDIYGTLIDNESGIFNALAPLLSRCPYRFERAEALSFYFESESGVKERNAVPYSEILALAHTDMSKRLGLVPSNVESSVFASSIVHWPLVDGAVECLQQLRPWIPALVALSDTDHETLQNTAAFSRLGPYFAEVFTWDASHRYRPDIQALAPSFLYHDAMGVLRGHRCLVSSGLFQDLEVACRLAEVPVIWMRYPASLAVNLDSDEASFAWTVCDQLPALVSTILREKCRAIFRNMDHCL